jgi:hypothetical protein
MAVPYLLMGDNGRSLPQGSKAVHAQLRQLAAIVCK